MKVSVDFDRTQWPEAVAQQLQSSLRSAVVPGRYLYDSPAQSARWLAYHERWSPARTETAVMALYDGAFRAALDQIPDAVSYVSLGCGGGQKDARWAQRAGARATRTVLTDTSPALVLTAGQRVTDAGARAVDRVVVDLSAEPDRAAYGIHDDPAVVWSCLGILPNFEHERLLPYLRRLMAPQDRLVLSANLSPGPYATAARAIVPQYDNAEARAWYDGALLELGFALDRTDRRLDSGPVAPDGEIWRMQYWATPRERTRLDVYGATVDLEPAVPLLVFQSTRYTPERLQRLCADAGLAPVAAFVDPDRVEGVYLLRSAESAGGSSGP